LFYYSGHGVQVNDINYLIPLGVTYAKVSKDAIALDDIFIALDSDLTGGNANLTKIVVLDACRDEKGNLSTGLARPDNAPTGTLIAYATAPDSPSSASGDNKRNSLYTEYLLKYLGTPGLGLNDLFTQVRSDVYEASAHIQVPWESTSTKSSFQFEPALRIESLEFNAPSPDDLVIVLLNDKPAIENWRDGKDPGWINVTASLHPGSNHLEVQVYNDRTYRNGLPWNPREGWHYTLKTRVAGVESESWSEGQDDGIDKAHWGALFTTLTGNVLVDPKTGKVTFSGVMKVPH
jgi:hypothetical protein